jgi:hypothetical protein
MKDKNNLIRLEDIGKAFGSLGGNATMKKYGRKHFKKLSELGIKARNNKKKAENPTASI